MSDHTGTAPRDLRTCRERQDAAIANLERYVQARAALDDQRYDLLADETETLHAEIDALRARVATLEAQQAAQKPTYYIATPDGPGFVHSPGYPQEDAEPPDGSAYSFQDDNRPTPVKSQRGECPIVVRVPVAGDVDWDSGAVSWREGWTARGWQKVTP
jgi:hypothetical protein